MHADWNKLFLGLGTGYVVKYDFQVRTCLAANGTVDLSRSPNNDRSGEVTILLAYSFLLGCVLFRLSLT